MKDKSRKKVMDKTGKKVKDITGKKVKDITGKKVKDKTGKKVKDKTGKKVKNKHGKMKDKNFKDKEDMEEILSDPRFAHVPFDPKLRQMPKEERKVKLDSRFSSMFSDDKFYEKSTMDPRGRPGNYSTKEDLRKFYDLSTDEEESDEDEDKVDETTHTEEDEKEEDEEDEGTVKESKDIKRGKAGISEDIQKRLQDMTQDYARGVHLFSDDSSDDDSTSDDEEQNEFQWGELDQDAIWDTEQDIEETSRLAVCNLDWNHIKAVDILVLFNSFCPRGGSISKVIIYPSEFGKERMAEEDQFGPMELTAAPTNQRPNKANRGQDVDLDKLEKGKLNYRTEESTDKFEALRQYERNRLRYYYAVVECESVDTAKVLYKECDRQSFERAGIYMDLRYIPEDMTFDEEPHDSCTTVPEFYEAKLFVTTALFDSQPTLTWDQTDPHRKEVLSRAMKNAMLGNEINEKYLQNFIASSSEDEESPAEVEGDYSSDEGDDARTARIAKFRALIQEIDEKEKKKKEGRFNMEEVFGIEEEDEGQAESSDEDSDDDKTNLKPFEQYLEKKKMKRKEKEKKKADASKEGEEVSSSSEEEGQSDGGISDDELPEDMGDMLKDPFFAEELKERQKQEGKGKKKKKKKEPKKEGEEKEIDQGDLELLLMDEDKEENKHFSMREIIEEHKGKSKKKLKKKAKKKLEEKMKERSSAVDDFKVDVQDSRFTNLLISGEYNIDPSHPQFKRTKAMDNLINDVQKKRIADSFENTPDSKRVNTGKGREEHELSMLVKRVKNKAKKPKNS